MVVRPCPRGRVLRRNRQAREDPALVGAAWAAALPAQGLQFLFQRLQFLDSRRNMADVRVDQCVDVAAVSGRRVLDHRHSVARLLAKALEREGTRARLVAEEIAMDAATSGVSSRIMRLIVDPATCKGTAVTPARAGE